MFVWAGNCLHNYNKHLGKLEAKRGCKTNMKNILMIRMAVLTATIGLLMLIRPAYGQVDKGQVEVTGQVGLVSGIGTHGAFGGSIGAGLSDNVLAYGEFLYIPLGSTTLGSNTLSARSYNFDGGLQYQFRKYGAMVPYGNVGLGLLRSTASLSSSSFSFQGFNFNTGGTANDFYANLGGGIRYYVTDNWGFRPEFTIFAGASTFVRIGAGVFYAFPR